MPLLQVSIFWAYIIIASNNQGAHVGLMATNIAEVKKIQC